MDRSWKSCFCGVSDWRYIACHCPERGGGSALD
jgi:hypothetical protein